MGLLQISRRDAASRFRVCLTLSAFAFPALLFISGCNQPAEPDVAGVDTAESSEPGSTEDPLELVKSDTASDATVPDEPISLPTAPAKLAVGDRNPGLQIAKWVKGDAVEAPLEEKVHVVEFWATWCGPCRVGMPHISELQTKYGDEVAFIGVTREDQATVESFLAKNSPDGRTWDEVIEYRLAIDDQDWMSKAYMRAAGQNGIPCAFVVGRDGTVEWIGHPGRIDEPLRQIVDGSWDREAQARLATVGTELTRFARAGDWDGALELLAKVEEDTGSSEMIAMSRVKVLEAAGRTEEVSKARAALVEVIWEDATKLNDFAWTTATNGEGVDLELALKAAEQGSKLKGDKDPAILDTVARCYYELGKLDEAIRWQRLAVENNTGFAEVEATLEKYLKEKGEAGTSDDESESAESAESAESDSAE